MSCRKRETVVMGLELDSAWGGEAINLSGLYRVALCVGVEGGVLHVNEGCRCSDRK